VQEIIDNRTSESRFGLKGSAKIRDGWSAGYVMEIGTGGADGVLISHGGEEGGYSLYVLEGRLHYAHNYLARTLYHVESGEMVPVGRHRLRYEFEATGKPDIAKGKGSPGRGQLYIDDRLVGQIDIPVTMPIRLQGGIIVGANPGSLSRPITGRRSGSPVRSTGSTST